MSDNNEDNDNDNENNNNKHLCCYSSEEPNRLKWLLPDDSTGGLVVSKALIPQP